MEEGTISSVDITPDEAELFDWLADHLVALGESPEDTVVKQLRDLARKDKS